VPGLGGLRKRANSLAGPADREKRILDALNARKATGDSVRKIAARFGVAASTVQTISRPFAGVRAAA
jgi:transposase